MMVPEVITRRRLTLADYEALPNDLDYEIVDGVLYMSPRPRPGHQIVANKLAVIITVHVSELGLGEVIPDADLIVDARDTYVSPDIMFFRSERVAAINRNDWLRLIPDLVVEVLSPSTEDYDRKTKRRTYEQLAVAHYWIVDVDRRMIAENVLQPTSRFAERIVGPDGSFRPALFPNLAIDLSRIFAS